jgi:S1-C subfamily serine protease
MNMLKTWRTGIPILAASLLMLLGTACQAPGGTSPTAATSPLAVDPPAAAPTSPVAVSPLAASAPMGSFSTAVRQVTQQVEPAVVQITNEQVQVDMFTGNPFTVPAGVGSGVIYDNQGHILTNNHVVEGAQTLLVSLPDGRSFKGKLIGADPQTDLAVVQISGSNLPVAELGDSRQLQVGDWLVAIGNALALPGGPTVTAGVVSALDRTVQEPGSSIGQTGPFLFDVIQTDAPINPGNSGGPLVNLDGQVVGINTLVAGQAEPGVQAQGIGFAIAIATAKPIADQLVATGHVVHASMGVSYVPLNSAIAIQLGITAQQGVVVTDVSPGSPAADAGLQPQDVITAINDQPLNTESALAQIVNSHQPGDTLTLTVIRGTQQLTLQVTLVAAPSP